MIRRTTLLAGLGARPPAPFVGLGTWTDDVDRMHALLERLQDRVPDLKWKPPETDVTGHVLTWTEGGRPLELEARLLGDLCKLAEVKWPA